MKIICIGRNYAKHIEELANEKPESPVVFLKPDSAILPRKNPFFIPPFSDDVHYEVEVLIKINKVGKHIDTKFAHKYYDEIGLGIDFTARDVQQKCKEKGLPWEKAKAFDGSAVISEKFIPLNELGKDIQDLRFSLLINNSEVQLGHTSDMIFSVDALIVYLSKYMTLKTGDLLFTGTPAGVGSVAAGDKITGFLEGVQMLSVNVK